MKKITLIVILFLAFNFQSFANNLIVGTPSISGNTLTFTIKWDNSWNVTTGPSNWDAVWIFVKRQTCVSGAESPWIHAELASSGQTITGSELQVDLAADRAGVFIRRSAAGMGNITQATVTLTLNSAINTDNIGVYGMEMVNVPEGQFYIGDGHPNAGDWQINFTDGNTFNPKLITQAIQQSGIGTSNNYSRVNSGSNTALGPNFPLGYNSFYCMKYEITTAQYVAFLNTLTYNQQLRIVRNANQTPPESAQGTLINNTYNGYRIEIKTPGDGTATLTPAVFANDATDDNNFDQSDDGLGLAVGLGTKQFLSYMDWAALRPMTEFEFEKACRGPVYPVVNESSWGSTDYLAFNNFTVNNRLTSSETLSGTGLGMANIQTNMNYRVGISATATSNRVKAGATYYGILDMTGGMLECVVGFHNTDYSTFSTTNGDGNITSLGFSDVVGWNEVIIGARGASWRREQNSRPISARGWNQHWQPTRDTYNEPDWADFGGRGVRSF
jgi:formylglycine-generating enzyme required for sulfatase activity